MESEALRANARDPHTSERNPVSQGEGLAGRGKTFDLTILCPDRTVFTGKAVSIVAPCERGYLGVLADHAPLIAGVVPGQLTVKTPEGQKVFTITGDGFLHVLRNDVALLVKNIS